MKKTLMMGTRKEPALLVIPKDCLLPEFSFLPHPLPYSSDTQQLVCGLRPIYDLCLPVQDEKSSATEIKNLENFIAIRQSSVMFV